MKREMILHPDEISEKWTDRMIHAGIDILGIHPAGGKDACDALRLLTERMETPEYRARIDYAVRRLEKRK